MALRIKGKRNRRKAARILRQEFRKGRAQGLSPMIAKDQAQMRLKNR